MTDEFLEPTFKGRRNLLLVFLAGSTLAGVIRFLVWPALAEHMRLLPKCTQLEWLWNGVSGFLGFAVIATLWAIPCGIKVLRSGRSPLPGAWVLRRTRIKRGNSARRGAYVLLALPIAALVLSFWTWHLLQPMALTAAKDAGCERGLSVNIGANIRK